MGLLEDLLGGACGAFGQGRLGMNQQQHIAQQSGLRAMTGQEMAGLGLYIAAPPPSFDDWICTPNTETYQEYQERRLPSTHNTSTTPETESNR